MPSLSLFPLRLKSITTVLASFHVCHHFYKASKIHPSSVFKQSPGTLIWYKSYVTRKNSYLNKLTIWGKSLHNLAGLINKQTPCCLSSVFFFIFFLLFGPGLSSSILKFSGIFSQSQLVMLTSSYSFFAQNPSRPLIGPEILPMNSADIFPSCGNLRVQGF